MSIMHHYIVNSICKIPTENYALVGDDLVIKGTSKQYNDYCRILAKIGMEVNQNKTIVSEKNNKRGFNIEFARNYIINSIPIKPIEYGILYA